MQAQTLHIKKKHINIGNDFLAQHQHSVNVKKEKAILPLKIQGN